LSHIAELAAQATRGKGDRNCIGIGRAQLPQTLHAFFCGQETTNTILAYSSKIITCLCNLSSSCKAFSRWSSIQRRSAMRKVADMVAA
jgi:hypothetical protein